MATRSYGRIMMKSLFLARRMGIGSQDLAAVTPSLKYSTCTTSPELTTFPEFVEVELVDEQPVSYYDSVLRKKIPKQDWMAKSEGPGSWKRSNQALITAQKTFKNNINIAKQNFNPIGGVHIYQAMYGCQWDDETKQINGYQQYGYDGEDFISFDLNTGTWVAPKPQGLITKHQWDADRALIERAKNDLTQRCPEYLEMYVVYGSHTLTRKDLPSVSFLQRSSSSQVSCFATGFYPSKAEMFWRKDGAEIHNGVEKGEILPNNDGTYQMSADIDLSSVPPEDRTKYECVFQLSGEKDLIHELKKTKIKTNKNHSMLNACSVFKDTTILTISGIISFIIILTL
ncbi:PREDICTED: major histocompatibility complex class I-related gene protein-like [Cyprinodon variegatus]|uniref:major histocompatibility complex class I-related gene protein-like n=1 Tax=Cyprinodon variegatus TaxID=28743 RepID=UPI0007426C4F|nr:PREDICTED: major histocompatibility complex class I-related gene protein-like [Cyprinodon variegatus]